MERNSPRTIINAAQTDCNCPSDLSVTQKDSENNAAKTKSWKKLVKILEGFEADPEDEPKWSSKDRRGDVEPMSSGWDNAPGMFKVLQEMAIGSGIAEPVEDEKKRDDISGEVSLLKNSATIMGRL